VTADDTARGDIARGDIARGDIARGDIARGDDAPVLEALGLCKVYGAADNEVHAVRDVDVAVASGSMTVVTGRSGSGKTTLLNLLGGLDTPTSGIVRLAGRDIAALSDVQKADLRRSRVGFVFQAFGLLPMLSAAENVEVPLRLAELDPAERSARSAELLDLVGLSPRAAHRPHELSGGEQQRVAIARALANRPDVILADEPTGQLDSRTGAEIVRMIAGLVESERIAILVATHDPAPLAYADRVLAMSDGRLEPAVHH
jgi:putative ABC transport system ATP-binding protein